MQRLLKGIYISYCLAMTANQTCLKSCITGSQLISRQLISRIQTRGGSLTELATSSHNCLTLTQNQVKNELVSMEFSIITMFVSLYNALPWNINIQFEARNNNASFKYRLVFLATRLLCTGSQSSIHEPKPINISGMLASTSRNLQPCWKTKHLKNLSIHTYI